MDAGSERNKSSGAVGERLKEACSINQSLTTLGRSVPQLAAPCGLHSTRHPSEGCVRQMNVWTATWQTYCTVMVYAG